VNAFWARTARELAELGTVVLRFDYSREGETLPIGEGRSVGPVGKRDLDLSLLVQAVAWFRRRADSGELLFAGACAGARLAIEFAGLHPGNVAGTFLVAPHLKPLPKANAANADGVTTAGPDVDLALAEGFRKSLTSSPSRILVGEHDMLDAAGLRRSLGPQAQALTVECLAGVALHLLDRPHVQRMVCDRLKVWVPRPR
jgi:dienelactone hydrolase